MTLAWCCPEDLCTHKVAVNGCLVHHEPPDALVRLPTGPLIHKAITLHESTCQRAYEGRHETSIESALVVARERGCGQYIYRNWRYDFYAIPTTVFCCNLPKRKRMGGGSLHATKVLKFVVTLSVA